MYITHTVHIPHSISDCIAAVAQSPQAWFPGLTADGSSRVGIKVGGVALRKRVAVELGNVIKYGTWAEIPITWKSTSAEPFFPVFDGKVQLAPVDPAVTRLTVSGMYKPPLGRIGEELDAAVMHSVAEGTVKDLAELISRRLDEATT